MMGYEKIADIMVKHDELAAFQRFEYLNTLNILYLQAELVHLQVDLKKSMQEDLESGSQLEELEAETVAAIFPEIETTPDHEAGSADLNVDLADQDEKCEEATSSLSAQDVNNAPSSRPAPDSASEVEHPEVIDTSTEADMRRLSARDWWCLSNLEGSKAWEIMLKTRQLLREYSKLSLSCTFSTDVSFNTPWQMKRSCSKPRSSLDLPQQLATSRSSRSGSKTTSLKISR